MTKIKNRLKKGFTLVELAIVIAVIAILIAVLVPTFISLINSAEESRDIQTLYNVNNALSIENATTTIETPEQALDVAEEAGYTIEKISPTSDGSIIIYDQKTVSFALVNNNTITYPENNSIDLDAPTTWYIVSSQEEITSGNVSYILTGTWDTTITYTGAGGIDTSRATVNAGVYIKYEAATSQASFVKQSVSAKVLTSGSEGSYPVIFNYGNSWGLTYEPGSRTEKPVIYGDKNYNLVDSNGDTLSNAENYVTVSSASTAVQDTKISYTTDNSGTISFTYAGVVVTATNIITSEDGTLTIELGTTDNPYTIASEDDYYKINKGGYCKVVSDKVTSTAALTVYSTTEATLDLNGCTLTISGTSSRSNIVNNGTLTITDSSTAKNGTLVVNTATYGIYNTGTLTIEDGKITGKQVIYLNNSSASLYMKGGTITATGTSVQCYGIYANQSKEVSVTGGTVEVTGGYNSKDFEMVDVASCAIYINNTNTNKNGNLTVSNTTIDSSDAGINYTTFAQNDNPTVTISGCDITAKGYAIYSLKCSVTITGGTYTGNINMTGTETQTAGLTISGGTFKEVSLTTASYGDFSMTGSTLDGVNFVLRNNIYSNVTISECKFYGTSIITSNVNLSGYFDSGSESYSYTDAYDNDTYTYTYTVTATTNSD